MSNNLKRNLASESLWIRLIYMLLFALIYQVVELLVLFTTVTLFLFTLIGGRPNENLRQFGSSLSQYAYQIFSFLTFNRDRRPYPFTDWPEPESPAGDMMTPAAAPVAESSSEPAATKTDNAEAERAGEPAGMTSATEQEKGTTQAGAKPKASQPSPSTAGEDKPARAADETDSDLQKPVGKSE